MGALKYDKINFNFENERSQLAIDTVIVSIVWIAILRFGKTLSLCNAISLRKDVRHRNQTYKPYSSWIHLLCRLVFSFPSHSSSMFSKNPNLKSSSCNLLNRWSISVWNLSTAAFMIIGSSSLTVKPVPRASSLAFFFFRLWCLLTCTSNSWLSKRPFSIDCSTNCPNGIQNDYVMLSNQMWHCESW